MPDNVTILYRGASYQIGQGKGFFGIWPAGAPQPPSIEWWPETPEGWQGAWSRFTGIEAPGTIVPIGQPAAQVASTGSRTTAPVASTSSRTVVAAALLLIIGVACGVAGLFPGYLGGASLAQQPAQLVPHVIYLAAWSASALLILLGGGRQRAGALLAAGISVVTFGLFLADAGTAIAGGSRLLGAGLVLGLVGWLACACGSGLAFWRLPAGAPGRPQRYAVSAVLTLAGLGAAAAFAPSWDSYVLRIATGASETVTAGNAFAYPAPVIAGDVAVMVALAAVVITAALWRPIRLGVALLAGAIIPMAAQAISALIQLGEATSPTLFNFTPAQAAQAGLTISNGLTPAFWIYCAFVVALIVTCAWMLIAPRRAVATTVPAAVSPVVPAASPPAVPPAAGTLS